jgi:hypothetical protein
MKAYILWPLLLLAGPGTYSLLVGFENIGLTLNQSIFALFVILFFAAVVAGVWYENKIK